MADSIIGVLQATSPDKKLDTTSLTVGANTVERERVQTAGSGAAELCDVKNAMPAVTAYGQVVRTLTPTVATATTASVAASATAVTLFASNTAALGRSIYNDSTSVLFVKCGSAASNTSFKVRIASQGYFEFPTEPFYNGIVTGIWTTATGSARTEETP